MIFTDKAKSQLKGKRLDEILRVLDPLPKINGQTNFDLLKFEIGPLMIHLKDKVEEKKVPVFWIDLFSGAGGTTSGIHLANDQNLQVIACVNHDKNAILSHKLNHPNCIHFIEDVRDFNVVLALKRLVESLRKEFPECKINLWASLECTNYSKAKGGLPRDADSRTLANALFMYLEQLDPDYLFIENVREFMAWGPLDDNGRPISRLNGRDYIRWIKKVKSYGFDYDHQLFNSADFGAYTSRERYFGQFARKGYPIRWPEATHSKKPEGGLFASKKKWMAVREVLDLEDEGQSIFTRNVPLSENTLKRIYAGLVKFVGNGDDIFIQKYFSGDPSSKVQSASIPAGAITTIDHHSIVRSCFLSHYYGNGFNTSLDTPCPTLRTKDSAIKIQSSFLVDYQYSSNAHGLDKPSPTLVTKDKLAKTDVKFMTNYYSGGGQLSDISNPNPTLTAIPKKRLTSVLFMDQQYGQSKPTSLEQPTGTITGNPKQNLVSVDLNLDMEKTIEAHRKNMPWFMDTNFSNIGSEVDKPLGVITANRKYHYLMNPSWGGHSSSIDKPSPVIVARQDKAPIYNVSVSGRKMFAMPFFPQENETMQKIRLFMAMYGIVDIKMRMLKIRELLKIQGFPEDYKMNGTKTDMKKFIGNAVVPLVAKKLAVTNYEAIQENFKVSA